MSMPRASEAVVPLRKLTDYLLSDSHPVGQSKARFFHACGFTRDSVGLLRDALLCVAREGAGFRSQPTGHGVKYVVDGMIVTPRQMIRSNPFGVAS